MTATSASPSPAAPGHARAARLDLPVRIAAEARCRLGEAPHWDPRARCLWWVDIALHRVWRLDADGVETSWPVPDSVSAAIPLRDSRRLLLALGAGLAWFDAEDGTVEPWVTLAPGGALRTNETRCDAQGRAWVSLMQNNLGPQGEELALTDDIGSLFRVDADGRAEVLLERLGIPNTLAWTADGATLYHADSRAGVLRAFPCEGERLGEPRVLLAGGVPDGSAVDDQGHLWNARWGDGELLRIAPGGEVTHRLPLPARQPTSCCFGGERGERLFVTSARIGLAHPEEADGAVFEVDLGGTGFSGPPLHAFGGGRRT